MPKAAILGSGPAGMLAAHACALLGVPFRIFSLGNPSQLHGSQFLHAPIDGIAAPWQEIDVSFKGTEAEYREKVYGTSYTGPVSPTEFEGKRIVWDIRYVYRWLWEEYGRFVETFVFDARSYGNLTQAMLDGGIDYLFSSLPRNQFCVNENHTFAGTRIWAVGDAPDLDVRCPVRLPERSIVYCGDDSASWYRASNVFDHCTVEWPSPPDSKKPPVFGTAKVVKPLSTDCTCHPGIVTIGRYGEWKKGVYAAHAYDKTLKFLTAMGVQGVLF